MEWTEFDIACMHRALELASQYEGLVEPNPMVGCVLARDGKVIGAGAHQRYGGSHAEVIALEGLGGESARGATAYVTLEPCCHFGKTPPCTQALIAAGITRVVAAQRDPFPAVAGGGFAQLQAAGIGVSVGCGNEEARRLNAPYLMLVQQRRPWIIAKWAMSLDGKIATHTGHSRWISSTAAREVVHRLRGRVDAILIGSGTARADNPLLTARPAGQRIATRIVLDSLVSLSLTSQLIRTVGESPVLIATSPAAPADSIAALKSAGCDVWISQSTIRVEQCRELMQELGRRRMTNLLVEGGAGVLGTLFDAELIDEVHAFIAPKLIGGEQAKSPLAGHGLHQVPAAASLEMLNWQTLDGDLYFQGRYRRE
jgi:diaminohydroxyphosphoribosylaminopyrimidine deaminase/5-amino-6-(5-phosphoribosylamino)uracil reductase